MAIDYCLATQQTFNVRSGMVLFRQAQRFVQEECLPRSYVGRSIDATMLMAAVFAMEISV